MSLMPVIGVSLVFFIVPVVIYLFCSKVLKRRWLNVPIFILLLLILIVWQIFGYDIRNGNEIELIKDIRSFFHNDSVVLVWFEWLPAVMGTVLVNIAGAVKRFKMSKMKDRGEV